MAEHLKGIAKRQEEMAERQEEFGQRQKTSVPTLDRFDRFSHTMADKLRRLGHLGRSPRTIVQFPPPLFSDAVPFFF